MNDRYKKRIFRYFSSINKTTAAFYVLLGSCAFALSRFVSRPVGNVGVLLAYGVFSAVVITENADLRSRGLPEIGISFRPHPALFFPAVILWGMFVIGFILNPSFRALLRLGAFTVLSAITLFVVPAVVSRERAFTAIGVLGAVFMLLGLPAALLGTPFRIAGVVLSGVSGAPIDTFGIPLRSPTAVFDTQNYFRILVAFGTVCSAGVFAKTRSPWMAIVFVLNVFGVYLTLGRAARLATVVAALLAIAYLAAGRKALAGATIIGVFATVVGFGIGIGVVPGPTGEIQSEIGKRIGYWTAAYEAVLARPVLGWGLVDTDVAVAEYFAGTYTGVHNSYIRLFVIGGVVGGITYLLLSASALVVALQRVREHVPLGLTTYCLIVMTLLLQLFDGATIFGTNLSSVLWMLAIAYAQPDIAIGD